ncbi:hypothetical protein GUJ93_ZPchr0013g37684 [Zizania palustris]|uniref:Uncharacterized protein n=1 Tax=Zizania palustris TaxID=103762 RepID=A0A8J5WWK7_ZIZPA|nr:hypothetical protein GUJ93_ZPchr0013g37684 [Zizania palustris]
MGNASGREEDPAAAAGEGDGADVEDGGGDSSVRSSERGFPPYGGGGNHVRRACSVGVVGAGGGGGSPPGSPGRYLSPRMFVPQVGSRDPMLSPRFGCSFDWPSGFVRTRSLPGMWGGGCGGSTD